MPFVRLQRMLRPEGGRSRLGRSGRPGRLRRNGLIARKGELTVIVAPGQMSVVFRWLKRERQPAVLRRTDGRRFLVRPQAWLRRRPKKRA